ncbi:radical SAM family heme chaperone HemW [Eubacterium coprostanoligenes]|uniref:radical SAM family heme chaperone HemW n=1 Tax=Eubacterium coprostanoligenes TaxID=290054 RepID=UPI002353760A|nr:radical SAM family heme chaperone HemW [Eubacterium coprostanoligenes]MCI6254673.1 radical SAM family heme chaperone HemW [Eubacterium coprostanoligenes]MDY5399395.1 radical SAM family heme chaperone HemW [Eubacterium coprostanoligenes]
MNNERSGLYFHIPFCKSKCPYCDFYSVKFDEASAQQYVQEICDEIKQYQGIFDTVYFGGGTPSILPPELIGKILDCARAQFEISDDAEITVECNPSKDLSEDFKKYASYGVNRISVGMQSAVDSERFALGRVAGKNEVERTINYARQSGIENISLDLMLGTPKQTIESLDYSFDFIKSVGVPHVSAYMLKIEEGTKFFQMRDRLVLPDDDTVGEMYLKTVDTLASFGIKQYEISNFAVPGFESRHNTKYWTLTPYLGIGKSAHSFWGGKRFFYDREWNKIDDGTGGNKEEQIMLGLRLAKGIDKSLVDRDFAEFVKMGYVADLGERIALTPKGMLVSNTIINYIIG